MKKLQFYKKKKNYGSCEKNPIKKIELFLTYFDCINCELIPFVCFNIEL